MKEFYTNNLHSVDVLAQSSGTFGSAVVMAAVLKQVQGAQSFLKQVAALPSAPNLRRQQHASLLALLAKGLSFNSIQAAAVLEEISDEIWGEDLAPSLRTAVAQSVSESTCSELEPKRLGQDALHGLFDRATMVAAASKHSHGGGSSSLVPRPG